MNTTAQQMVAEAKSQISNLSVEEVAQELESGSSTLIDLREPEEIKRDGMIPGAVAAPRGMLEFWADPASPYHRPEIDPANRNILYCASGGRSALATQTLQKLGYSNIAHLDGGFKAWREQNCPVEAAPE